MTRIVCPGDWPAVEAAIMCGSSCSGGDGGTRPGSPAPHQSGTTLLDKFTHALIVKCTNEVSDFITMLHDLGGSTICIVGAG